jgi:hypothetical protein
MRTFLRLKNKHARRLPAEFRDQDVRYPDELVATFVQRLTRPGMSCSTLSPAMALP